MQQSIETLQKQLDIIEQFEALFNSENIQQFKQHLKKDNENTFANFMQGDTIQKTQIAFGRLSFPDRDARSVYVTDIKELLPSLLLSYMNLGSSINGLNNPKSTEHAFSFFNLAIAAVLQSEKKENNFFTVAEELIHTLSQSPARQQPPLINQLLYKIRRLIALQKEVVTKELQEMIAQKNIAEEQLLLEQTKLQSRNKMIRYTSSATLFTAGSVLTALSTVVHYHPQLIIAAGLNLPPIALAAVAVTGITMALAGAYLAYRTYSPSDPSANPAVKTEYSKYLTAAYFTLGMGLPGFSALVYFAPALAQFSPKFVLLMGLHINPAMLITATVLGALLFGVALYRACKASEPVPAVAQPTTEVVAQPANASCMQRVYKALCSFNIFGREASDTQTSSVALLPPNLK